MYELALALGMPVYQIEKEMPAEELNMWVKYFEARPFGWREDNRTAMLMNAQGVKLSSAELFPSLAALQKWEQGVEDTVVMQRSLKKSVFGALLENANSKE